MHWTSFWLGVVASWAVSILGVLVFLALDALEARRIRRNRNARPTSPNAELVARARQHGPVFHEEPDGQMVPLLGTDELGDLWPRDLA